MESTDSSGGSQQPQLPPGFRFHPTDEELVVHYLKKKAASAPLPVAIIAEVDLYKFDPWELPAKATFGEQEWYFFSPRDRKYPNGARPNRAATSGYWKATGTDKPVLTAGGTQKVGVKKALVFYGGKPPKGIKTNWIMHEYRLTDGKTAVKPPGCDKKGSLRLDDWVLCRIYKKNSALPQRPMDRDCRPCAGAGAGPSDIHDMMGSIPPATLSSMLLKANNYASFMETDTHHNHHQNLFDIGMMAANNSIPSHHLPPSGAAASRSLLSPLPLLAPDPNLLPPKRQLSNLYWNDDDQTEDDNSPQTKRFLAESCQGRTIQEATNNNNNPNNNNNSNSLASILSQIPQTPSLQEQQYQVTGMNWYT